MNSLPAIVAILVVFALPYLVIYLQSRRLGAVERQLSELTSAIRERSAMTAGRAEPNA